MSMMIDEGGILPAQHVACGMTNTYEACPPVASCIYIHFAPPASVLVAPSEPRFGVYVRTPDPADRHGYISTSRRLVQCSLPPEPGPWFGRRTRHMVQRQDREPGNSVIRNQKSACKPGEGPVHRPPGSERNGSVDLTRLRSYQWSSAQCLNRTPRIDPTAHETTVVIPSSLIRSQNPHQPRLVGLVHDPTRNPTLGQHGPLDPTCFALPTHHPLSRQG
ncbi:hypothetical protein SODALDRAFT_354060 [Sodiomyces alkalinus F11]|uniref:Uncharacterized protein n=1 Tax=Sodiomyces alkalinus (strain CBS 110278 / VKM F-3762 / F11) TaxID=1314773 RepID=A0A3N2Q5G5_SODAK|nr:hypothetical protein SODALDRAFT_354060 [Sodiomyces alkalinus F11]ROT41937.1 hypothetical protein SODALDRAFT_354060 [Sodiomyces alkalinus F11]